MINALSSINTAMNPTPGTPSGYTPSSMPPTGEPTPVTPPPAEMPPVPEMDSPAPKKKSGGKSILAMLVLMVVFAGAVTGFYLVQRPTNLAQRASEGLTAFDGGACTAACTPPNGSAGKSQTNGGEVSGRYVAGKTDGGVQDCECFCSKGEWNASFDTCVGTGDSGDDTGNPSGESCAENPYICCNSDQNGAPVAEFIMYVCPEGCTYTTEGGVGAYRCYNPTPVRSSTPPSLNGQCGQVDQLKVAGDDSSYCGYLDYTCDEARCQQQPTPTPGASPSPSSSPVVSPSPSTAPLMCIDIRMFDTADDAKGQIYTAEMGMSVNFRCAEVAGADAYKFRLITPDGVIHKLEATGRRSAPVVIDQPGKYVAQCRVCDLVNGVMQCQRYEPLNGTNDDDDGISNPPQTTTVTTPTSETKQ